MRKLIVAGAIAAGAVLSSTGCGSVGPTAPARSPATSAEPAQAAVSETATTLAVSSTMFSKPFLRAELDEFVHSFRASYPALSDGRDETSIENMAISVCNDLLNGVDASEVLNRIRTYTANATSAPTPDQADGIHDMIVEACP